MNFIRIDHDLMKMISIVPPSINLSENILPSIHHHRSVYYNQISGTSTPSNQNTGAARHRRSLSLPSTSRFPKVPSSYSPSEKVVYEAYTIIHSLKSQVTEKGDIYTDLAYYLMYVSRQKPIYMTRTDWSMDQISLIQAVKSFKCYFDYLDDFTTKFSRSKESVNDNEIEPFARLYEIGDTEKVGWDKSDVFDMYSNKSSGNAYYLIEKNRIKGNHRLQFSEFLRCCLPDHKKFDDSNVNRFYSIFHKRRLSLVRCS